MPTYIHMCTYIYTYICTYVHWNFLSTPQETPRTGRTCLPGLRGLLMSSVSPVATGRRAGITTSAGFGQGLGFRGLGFTVTLNISPFKDL